MAIFVHLKNHLSHYFSLVKTNKTYISLLYKIVDMIVKESLKLEFKIFLTLLLLKSKEKI